MVSFLMRAPNPYIYSTTAPLSTFDCNSNGIMVELCTRRLHSEMCAWLPGNAWFGCLQMLQFSRSATVQCSPNVGVRSAETSHTSRVASTQVGRISFGFRFFVRRLQQLRCNSIEALQSQSRHYLKLLQKHSGFRTIYTRHAEPTLRGI